MPKMTKKYSGALAVARQVDKALTRLNNQERLYTALAEYSYQWDSKRGEWLYAPPEQGDPPTDLVRIRVWAAHDSVQDMG